MEGIFIILIVALVIYAAINMLSKIGDAFYEAHRQRSYQPAPPKNPPAPAPPLPSIGLEDHKICRYCDTSNKNKRSRCKSCGAELC